MGTDVCSLNLRPKPRAPLRLEFAYLHSVVWVEPEL
jgi:hypothetical protein